MDVGIETDFSAYLCLIIYCIFFAIKSCCICLILILTSMGVILPYLRIVYNAYILLANSGWVANYLFIWASICSWIIFCCSALGAVIECWGIFFIICACIFIIIFCSIWNSFNCYLEFFNSSKTYYLNLFFNLNI